jgi:putative ABC transport system permease protein
MSLWRQLTYGLRSLTNRAQHDRETAEEVEQYFEEAEAAWRSRGLSAEDARRAARLEGGSMTAAQERVNSYGWENIARSFIGDLRFAGRQLWKHKVFTATATLTLALGIGANAAIFTVIQSVLLAPLPYRNADKLAVLNTHWTNSGHTTAGITGPDGVDVRDQARSIEAMSLYSGGNLGVQLRDHSVYTGVTFVDANFARVFSLQPIAGRLFSDADAHHAALVSEQFARYHFGSTQAALGQTVHVESEPVEIVGVLPGSFDFPAQTRVWEAFPLRPASEERTAFNYKAVARLRSGTTFQAAQTELIGISRRLETAYPEANRNKQILPQPLREALIGNTRPTLLFLWAAVGLILLIACVNVTHLQLVRSMERQRELAIRRALGSSSWQVMQPVMLESLLVSLIGGAAGVLLAFPAVRVLVAMAPKDLPRTNEIHLNGWAVGFTLALSVLTAFASSVLPALKAAKVDPAETLKQDASRGVTRQGAAMLRDGLVVAEVAATFVLAVGAALLLHTMMALINRDLGYQTRQLLVVDADAPAHSGQDAQRVVRQFSELFAQLAAMPGVTHVAGIMGLPTGAYGSNGYYTVTGAGPVDVNHSPYADFSVASPGYFQAMGIPIKRGRDFSAQDTDESGFVAVISASLAKQSFGNADPVGKQVQCGLDSDKWMTVVGVVGDVRQESPAENPGPTLYMPMTQHPFYANQIHIVLRTEVKPLTLMSAVQEAVARVNPFIAMRFTTMDAMVNTSIATERFRAALISSFAGVGLLLAMLGVYGTMAYTVAQRTFEIGVRMAFGAERGAILGTVLAHAAKLAGYGIAVGLVLSLLLARLVTSMLAGVRPTDPVSLGVASLLLLLTALAAALAPGWRATHVDPMVALRSA